MFCEGIILIAVILLNPEIFVTTDQNIGTGTDCIRLNAQNQLKDPKCKKYENRPNSIEFMLSSSTLVFFSRE